MPLISKECNSLSPELSAVGWLEGSITSRPSLRRYRMPLSSNRRISSLMSKLLWWWLISLDSKCMKCESTYMSKISSSALYIRRWLMSSSTLKRTLLCSNTTRMVASLLRGTSSRLSFHQLPPLLTRLIFCLEVLVVQIASAILSLYPSNLSLEEKNQLRDNTQAICFNIRGIMEVNRTFIVYFRRLWAEEVS